MKCEKCNGNGAQFMGSMKSWGPDPSDCFNDRANMPGGFAWLCERCEDEVVGDIYTQEAKLTFAQLISQEVCNG